MILEPYTVPYYGQLASPELARAIFDDSLDPACDPRWPETGANTPQDYAYWAPRMCGMACLKMVAEAFDGPTMKIMEWLALGLRQNGYIIGTDQNGASEELGWDHRVLANLLEETGISAKACPGDLDDVISVLNHQGLVIASVTYELGQVGPLTRRNGHLVVITGIELCEGKPVAVFINNPSGRTPALRQRARISGERFLEGFSGRIIKAFPPPILS